MHPVKLRKNEKYVQVCEESKVLAETEIKKYVDKINANFCINLKYPEIFYAEKKEFGWATCKNQIVFSAKYLDSYGIGFLMETGAHEVAHLAVDILYPRAKAHGREWKAMAQFLGCSHKATRKNPDISYRSAAEKAGVIIEAKLPEEVKRKRIDQRLFEWECGCRSHILGPRSNNSLIGFPKGKICVHCKGYLSFVRQIK